MTETQQTLLRQAENNEAQEDKVTSQGTCMEEEAAAAASPSMEYLGII